MSRYKYINYLYINIIYKKRQIYYYFSYAIIKSYEQRAKKTN